MEATKIKMNMDGTIRAKVLQYKSDGNTLTEKWETLTKFAEGIYLSYAAPDRYEQVYATVVFAKNGVFWKVGCEPEQCFNPDSYRYAENMENLKRMYADYEADILQAATNGGWLNKLHITVMERLGHDAAPLLAAYEERKRKWQEEERKRIEAAEKAECERIEAEERRKAEVLADGKEKLMNHECVTVEQIELIAETVGYKINIRTIGFMREKVTEAVLRENSTVTAWGRKLTSRNIDGMANVLRELYNRLKAQAEEEAKQPATPAETPRISKETAETVNVSAEGEKEAQRAKNKPTFADVAQMVKTELAKNKAMRTAWHLEFPDGTECDVRYKLTAVGCDFYEYTETRNGEEAFKDYKATECDITFYICQRLGIDAIEPPQSTETPQTAECTAESCKLAQTA